MVVTGVLLAVAVAVALGWTLRSERAFARRRLLLSMHGARADAVGGIGLSVLLPEGVTPRLAEELLSTEYALFEVVAVVDGLADPALLAQLAARYRLFRVSVPPADGTRALYRSRKRRFRRLVLLDRPATDRRRACRAAAEAATYDYLLPLRPNERLTCGAVERVVCELAAAPGTAVLRSLSGARGRVFCRAAFGAACRGKRSGLLLRPCRTLCDPITVRRRPPRALRRAGWAVAAVTAAAGAAAAPAWWVAAAWVLTLLVVLLAAVRIGQLRRTCG